MIVFWIKNKKKVQFAESCKFKLAAKLAICIFVEPWRELQQELPPNLRVRLRSSSHRGRRGWLLRGWRAISSATGPGPSFEDKDSGKIIGITVI